MSGARPPPRRPPLFGDIEVLKRLNSGDGGWSGVDSPRIWSAGPWTIGAGFTWRDVSGRTGKWNTIHRRFRGWTYQGDFALDFRSLRGKPPSDALWRKARFAELTGRSRVPGSATANRPSVEPAACCHQSVVPTDALGKLVDFVPLPGRSHGTRRSKRRSKSGGSKHS